jgi:methylated-DNA-[protein]-cysteine S-methyltransferase
MRGHCGQVPPHVFCANIHTTIGMIGIVWGVNSAKTPRLKRMYLPLKSDDLKKKINIDFPHVQENKNVPFPGLIDRIRALADGNDAFISRTILDLTDLTPFVRRVYTHTQSIPRGHVRTYSELAEDVKSPRAARAVGNTLKNNLFPLIIPCHRVIPSTRFIGEFQAGSQLKWKLLAREGLRIDSAGRVKT